MILKFLAPKTNEVGKPNKPDKFCWIGDVVRFHHEVIDIPVDKDYYVVAPNYFVYRYEYADGEVSPKAHQILRLVIFTKNQADAIFVTTEAVVYVINEMGKTVEVLYPYHK